MKVKDSGEDTRASNVVFEECRHGSFFGKCDECSRCPHGVKRFYGYDISVGPPPCSNCEAEEKEALERFVRCMRGGDEG